MAAAAFTGHSVGSPEAMCVTVSCFSSFFCISKVMEIQSAVSKSGESCGVRQPSVKNRRLRSLRISVRRFSCCETLTYSHDRMAKKKARVVSCEIAICREVRFNLANCAMTQAGMACCCFSGGSLFLNARYCRCRRKLSCRSSSFVGFGRPCSRNVCETLEMVFLTVPQARVP